MIQYSTNELPQLPRGRQGQQSPHKCSRWALRLSPNLSIINLSLRRSLRIKNSCLIFQSSRSFSRCCSTPTRLLSPTRQSSPSGKRCKLLTSSKKKVDCGHDDRQYYAKGMCNNCYHKFGRTKKPWLCVHDKLYAAGLCQNCYINNYNKKRREKDSLIKSQEDQQDAPQQQLGGEPAKENAPAGQQ